MKIQPRQASQFTTSPPPTVRAVLVYGPDRGLVREHIKNLSLATVPDPNDPFNVSNLTGAALEAEPGRLSDEANAISMMGGKRLVRIDDGGDKLTAGLKEYLASPNENALVIIEAGELGPRSSLRKLMEWHDNAAALACYVEEAGDLAHVIRKFLDTQGYTAERDAIQWLAVNLQGDRGRVMAELDKLTLYKGENKNIRLNDAQACCGEEGQTTLDSFIYACADGDTSNALSMLSKLLNEGTAFIVIIRSLQTHFRRLHLVRARRDQGDSAEQAMKQLQPPVFFKVQERFRQQAQSWNIQAINAVIDNLAELEARCKQTGAPVDTLCAQAALAISLNKKRR